MCFSISHLTMPSWTGFLAKSAYVHEFPSPFQSLSLALSLWFYLLFHRTESSISFPLQAYHYAKSSMIFLYYETWSQSAGEYVTILFKYLAHHDHGLQNPKEPNANLIGMLLANLAKFDDLKRILTWTRSRVNDENLSRSDNAMDQLLDLFVKVVDSRYSPLTDLDYLAYLFADLAKVIHFHFPQSVISMWEISPLQSLRADHYY